MEQLPTTSTTNLKQFPEIKGAIPIPAIRTSPQLSEKLSPSRTGYSSNVKSTTCDNKTLHLPNISGPVMKPVSNGKRKPNEDIKKSSNRKSSSEDILIIKPTLKEISRQFIEQNTLNENEISTVHAESVDSTPADIIPMELTMVAPPPLMPADGMNTEEIIAADIEIVDNNGHVTLLYELYKESFPIKDGQLTAEEIDEVYNLTFVMPRCFIHLSTFNPQQRKEWIEANDGTLDFESFYIIEDPVGHYQGLVSQGSYYVYVEQEEEQLLRDQENMRNRLNDMKQQQVLLGIVRNDGRGFESCSCIYGNPCVDEYGCRDWGNRFAIALKNGWKGF